MLLQTKNVSKRFGGLCAVNNVDLEVKEGTIIAVIGPNGAGKTTFFNIVTGLYTPDNGTIELDGESLVHLKAEEIARKGIARTFQTIRLFKGMTLIENVCVPQAHRFLSIWKVIWRSSRYAQLEAQAIEYGYWCLGQVGLAEQAQELASSLSYGQQRRLEIARALALKPRLLLLDEPAAGMNAHEKAQMIQLIQELQKVLGITIVLIEHDMDMVAQLADQVIVFHHGEILAKGTPDYIRSHPDVIAAYLGESI